MSLFGKLFGGKGGREPISAREALPLAQEAAAQWAPAKTPHLCCVYTAQEDSGFPVDQEGRCRVWQLDYFLPEEQRFLLVRVQDGKAKRREKTRGESPVEYGYAVYGARGGAGAEPAMIPGDWCDSGSVVRAVYDACAPEIGSATELEDYLVLCVCLPGSALRYSQPQTASGLEAFFSPPPAAPLCYGVILTHIDVQDHDAFAVYVDARTGHVVQKERFRFPS